MPPNLGEWRTDPQRWAWEVCYGDEGVDWQKRGK